MFIFKKHENICVHKIRGDGAGYLTN